MKPPLGTGLVESGRAYIKSSTERVLDLTSTVDIVVLAQHLHVILAGIDMTKILIVEDNEMNRDKLSRRFARKGYEVSNSGRWPGGFRYDGGR